MLAIFFVTPPMVNAQSDRDNGLYHRIDSVVPNFGVVDEKLCRGGQPKKNGLKALKAAGIKAVINLRDGEDDIDEEREVAAGLGLKYVSIPMSAFKKARPEQIQEFFSVVNASQNQPVFVHCRQGKDRTGCMVAMYRMAKHGWSANQAHDEMLSYGFHQIFAGLTSSVYAFGGSINRQGIEGPREAGD
jgi:Protein tyrosine/serine phosphatase